MTFKISPGPFSKKNTTGLPLEISLVYREQGPQPALYAFLFIIESSKKKTE
jgi:hypothetical protein